MRNTYSQAAVRCIVFHEKGTWYGVALEFNIVVDGDAPSIVMDLLDQAVRHYFVVAKKQKLDPRVLNQKIDPEYASMWSLLENSAHRHQKKAPQKVPSNLYSSLVLRPAVA